MRSLSFRDNRMLGRTLVTASFMGVCAPAIATAQHFTGTNKIIRLSAPVRLDTTGLFEAAIARVGDDIFIGGQPTERALRDMRAQGVTTVVNLRTPPEMARSVKFDEKALVEQLGMKYVYLPV